MLMLRRVVGSSMLPTLHPGKLLLIRRRVRRYHTYDIIVAEHGGREIVKRITRLAPDQVYVEGDNPNASTDSRHFGWLKLQAVSGKVVWPRKI